MERIDEEELRGGLSTLLVGVAHRGRRRRRPMKRRVNERQLGWLRDVVMKAPVRGIGRRWRLGEESPGNRAHGRKWRWRRLLCTSVLRRRRTEEKRSDFVSLVRMGEEQREWERICVVQERGRRMEEGGGNGASRGAAQATSAVGIEAMASSIGEGSSME